LITNDQSAKARFFLPGRTSNTQRNSSNLAANSHISHKEKYAGRFQQDGAGVVGIIIAAETPNRAASALPMQALSSPAVRPFWTTRQA